MSDGSQQTPQSEPPPYQHPPYPGDEPWPHQDPGDEDDGDLSRRWCANASMADVVGTLREIYDGRAFAWRGDEDDDDLPRRWRANDAVLNIVGILREVYDDDEAFAWLIMPHNELHDATPLDLI